MLGMTETILGEQVMTDSIGEALVRARELLEESTEGVSSLLVRARATLDELEGVLRKPGCGSAAYAASVDLAVISLAAHSLIAQADACGDLD